MSARTSAARVLAAQKDIATAKQLGINAALKDDAFNDKAWSLASLKGQYGAQPVLMAIAEGAYFAKLQDLRGEASA